MLHSLARGMTIAVLLAAAGVYAGRVYTQAAPDVAAPFVEITSPGLDEVVSGLVTVTAATADNVGTVGVQFLLNGFPLGAETPASRSKCRGTAGRAAAARTF